MASSATEVVRKQGKDEGSPWPRGKTGRGPSSRISDITTLRTARMLEAEILASRALDPKPHLPAAA